MSDAENNPAPAQFPLLEELRAELTEQLPFCSGSLELTPECFALYYGKGTNARHVDLSGSSAADVEALDELEKACEAASFGRAQETVLDESYRKAGKMDTNNFVLPLNVEAERMIDIVRVGLLTGQKEKRDIKAELYKLNVYGKGAFFKAHKDTPRGTDMFGSLVIVFPTRHEGGELVLRHEGKEWTFDAAQILSGVKNTVAYIAFFSDVEHEVLPVKSGHRVTLTYNLYWSSPPPVALPKGLAMLFPKHANEPAMEHALSTFLEERTILPQGGTLGFTLRHAYPFPSRWEDDMPNPLDSLAEWLKGSDAALFEACTALGLKPCLRLIYEERYRGGDLVMLDHVASIGYCDTSEKYELCSGHGGVLVVSKEFDGSPRVANKRSSYYDEDDNDGWESIDVYWVTKDKPLNVIGAEYTAYGNEATTQYLYLYVSLFVDVGPAGDRTNIEKVDGVSKVKHTS